MVAASGPSEAGESAAETEALADVAGRPALGLGAELSIALAELGARAEGPGAAVLGVTARLQPKHSANAPTHGHSAEFRRQNRTLPLRA